MEMVEAGARGEKELKSECSGSAEVTGVCYERKDGLLNTTRCCLCLCLHRISTPLLSSGMYSSIKVQQSLASLQTWVFSPGTALLVCSVT